MTSIGKVILTGRTLGIQHSPYIEGMLCQTNL